MGFIPYCCILDNWFYYLVYNFLFFIMACTVNLYNNYISGTTTGGTWNYIGYSTTEGGIYGSGGNFPWSMEVWNIDVDFNGIIQGWYKLQYVVAGDCGGSVDVIIPVVGGGTAGVSKTITVSPSDLEYNLFSQLNAEWEDGVLAAAWSWSGSGTTSGYYNEKLLTTPEDDTFKNLELGEHIFVLSITPQTPAGWVLNSCQNCLASSATYTVNVEGVLLELSGCQFTATVFPSCSSGTYYWEQYFSGSWHVMSYSGGVNTWSPYYDFPTRVRVENCSGSPLYSNVITPNGCENNCTAVLDLTLSGCVISWNLTGCVETVYLKRPDNTTATTGGATGSFVADMDGIWTANVYNCPSCPTITKTISVTGCEAVVCGCTTAITENNCQLTGNDSDCAGYTGTWYWYDSSTGNWIDKGTANPIAVDNNGTWKRELIKSGCPVISEQHTTSCLPCIQIDSLTVDNVNCDRLNYYYSGAAGNAGIVLKWYYPTTNVTDCNTAAGWTEFYPTVSGSSNVNGTGNGYAIIPTAHQNKCIKLRIEDTTTNCGWVEDSEFVPICCDMTASITVTGCDPYTLTAEPSGNGETYLWSNGATTQSIDVQEGTYSVTVTLGDCSSTASTTVTCCTQPCTTQWTVCSHYIDFPDYSTTTAGGTQYVLTSLKVNGVEYVTGNYYVLPSDNIVAVAGAPNGVIFNAALVTGINNIAPNTIVAILPVWQDYLDANIDDAADSDYTGVIRIKKCETVTSIEIIRAELYGSTTVHLDWDITLVNTPIQLYHINSTPSPTTEPNPNNCVDENKC